MILEGYSIMVLNFAGDRSGIWGNKNCIVALYKVTNLTCFERVLYEQMLLRFQYFISNMKIKIIISILKNVKIPVPTKFLVT